MLGVIGILVLGIGGALVGLVAALRPRLRDHAAFRAAPWLILITAGGLASFSGEPSTVWAPAGAALIWLVVGGRRLCELALRAYERVQRPALAWTARLVACPLLAWSWAGRLTLDEEPLPEVPGIYVAKHREVQPSPYHTDAGGPFKVYVPERPATAAQLAEVEKDERIPNLICTGPAGSHCNCHGWVFTGGRYWIAGEHVEHILADNGYQPISAPRPGDLIVYRRGEAIVHTGIVRAADEHGVLIESKWDTRGRYIHTPEYQPYASEFGYYRSGRAGHLLRTASSAPSASAPAH